MMGWPELFTIIKISFVLIISSFALFLPLIALVNRKFAIKFTIPVSISLQIVFSYVFYCLSLTKYYPVTYFLLIIGLNIWSIWKLKIKLPKRIFQQKVQSPHIIACMLLFTVIIYNRFFDSFTNIAPGEIDTYNHIVLLKSLIKDGLLIFTQYAPGFHLFILPLTFFSSISEIYRFTGPIIGIITSISLYLLLKDTFKGRYSKYVLLLSLCIPIFNQLFLQEIGFFSTSLSFIFLPALAYVIATKPKADNYKYLLIVFSIITASLSLTLPYIYIQYLPTLTVLLLVALFIKKFRDSGYTKHLIIVFVISAIGLIISFGHVYLQTKILKRGTGFPSMELTYVENGEIVSKSNYQPSSSPDPTPQSNSNITPAPTESFATQIKKTPIFVQYISPMYNIAVNVFMVKNVRTPNNILSLGAYLWIILSIFILPISIKKNSTTLFTLSIFSIVFGIATQVGILEISTYRGRSGWYLMLTMLIGAVYIFDTIFTNKLNNNKIVLPIIIFSSLLGIIKPPIYYRPYHTKPFESVNSILKNNPNSSINIISDNDHISVLSENISITPLTESAVKKPCTTDICLLILENELLAIDPVLSQQASSIDQNYSTFKQQQNQAASENTIRLNSIKKLKEFSLYKLYQTDGKTEIYKLIKL